MKPGPEEENKQKMDLHLVKTGMNHILRSSPNTCCRFWRIPTLKPFLSGPVTKMGAEKASGEKKKKIRICLLCLLQFWTPPLSKGYKITTQGLSQQIIYKSFRQYKSSRGVLVSPHLKWICFWPPTNSGSQRGTWDWRRTWAPQTWGRGHGTLQAHLAGPPGSEKQEN